MVSLLPLPSLSLDTLAWSLQEIGKEPVSGAFWVPLSRSCDEGRVGLRSWDSHSVARTLLWSDALGGPHCPREELTALSLTGLGHPWPRPQPRAESRHGAWVWAPGFVHTRFSWGSRTHCEVRLAVSSAHFVC